MSEPQVKALTCSCGATPSPCESPGVGTYEENGALCFICYVCWCEANYGRGSVESLEAKRIGLAAVRRK